jgi:hypothetical protein
MSISPENQTFISQLRFRMAPGHTEPPTLDEMKRAILILRESRAAASAANAASAAGKRSSTKKATPSAAAVADALADLDSM